jgi:hypothetical protein
VPNEQSHPTPRQQQQQQHQHQQKQQRSAWMAFVYVKMNCFCFVAVVKEDAESNVSQLLKKPLVKFASETYGIGTRFLEFPPLVFDLKRNPTKS